MRLSAEQMNATQLDLVAGLETLRSAKLPELPLVDHRSLKIDSISTGVSQDPFDHYHCSETVCLDYFSGEDQWYLFMPPWMEAYAARVFGRDALDDFYQPDFALVNLSEVSDRQRKDYLLQFSKVALDAWGEGKKG